MNRNILGRCAAVIVHPHRLQQNMTPTAVALPIDFGSFGRSFNPFVLRTSVMWPGELTSKKLVASNCVELCSADRLTLPHMFFADGAFGLTWLSV